MSLRVLTKIFLYLMFIGTIVFVGRVFSYRIDNFSSYCRIAGLKLISPLEIKQAIDSLEIKDKYFYQINPKNISSYLAKRPLVAKVKIRTNIYPKLAYKIYIIEEEPWAFYRNHVLNTNAEIIINSAKDAKLYNSAIISQIYADRENYTEIKTSKEIGKDRLKTLKKLSDTIQDNLKSIQSTETIKEIILDKEENLTIHTQNLVFKLGLLDSKIFNRAKKLEVLFRKMKDPKELDYIDLSLSSSEILLGKKQAKIDADDK